MLESQRWRPILFKCPRTGQKVQALLADEAAGSGVARYEMVSCLACSGIHFVNPTDGDVLGSAANNPK